MSYISRLLIGIALLCIYASFSVPKPKDFTVITYNIWNGFESQNSRRDTFVNWAKKQNVDVIAFQELNNFTQASFSELAKNWGHPYAVISKENGYPVGISSKYPISNTYRLAKGMHHGCLYAEIKGISFFVVHFSPFSSARRIQEADSVIQTLQMKNKLKGKVIVLGDFNAFSPNDSLFYSNSNVKDSMYLAESRNKVLRNLNEVHEIDYTVLSRFFGMGLYDSFSLFHQTFQNTYPSMVYPSVPISDKCRIDHLLISEKLKRTCKSLEIIKDSVTDTLSDHYPIKAVFQ